MMFIHISDNRNLEILYDLTKQREYEYALMQELGPLFSKKRTRRRRGNIKKKFISFLPVAYKGVFVSLSPRKTPCTAKDKRTAGAPRDLNVKYWHAGVNMGESCRDKRPCQYIGNSSCHSFQQNCKHVTKINRESGLFKIFSNKDIGLTLPVKETTLAWIQPRSTASDFFFSEQ